jgi:hypothetical protein
MMIRLVIEGLKLQPCSPGFVDGRNAILAADQLLYGGAHLQELWTGFARRGLGFSATQGSSSTNSDNFEAFDLPFPPAQAGVTPSELVVNVPNGGVVEAQVQIANLAAVGSQPLNIEAAIVGVTPPGESGAANGEESVGGEYFTVSPAAASVEPGEDTTLTVTFHAWQPPSGIYTATLRLTTNDPDSLTIDVPLTMTAGGAVTIDGGPGWRLLSAPSEGLTVDSLAAQNLVEGLPDYYPAAAPNLFTSYNGSAWVPPAGGSHAIAPGRGFAWYFYDETFDPGGPSRSVELPMNVGAPFSAAAAPPVVSVPLHSAGSGLNLVGNPYRSPIDVSGLAGWATGGSLASAVGQLWDTQASSWQLTSLNGGSLSAWDGMMIENSTAGALDIPASAQNQAGVASPSAGATRLLAFELEATTAAGATLTDRGIALRFDPDATDGWDVWDATKLMPLAPAFAALAFEGVRDASPVLKAQESRPLSPEDPFDVTLDFAAVGTGSTFTLRWPRLENVPDTWSFMLQDLVTGQSIDLLGVREYTFTATPLAPAGETRALAGEPPVVTSFSGGTARFVLHVVPSVPTTNAPGTAPAAFALSAPAPNPAAGRSLVRFDVPHASDLRIEVFDLVGRRVSTVVDAWVQAGRHEAPLATATLAAGVYVVRMRAGDFAAARRFVVAGR